MNKPSATLILPLRDFSIAVENEMSELLVDSLPGLYTPASKSVIQTGSKNSRVRKESTRAVSGIDDADGRIVFDIPMIVENTKHERTRGTVGLCLVKDFINMSLDNSLHWVPNKITFHDILDAYLIDPSDQDQSLWCEERIRSLLMDLIDDLRSFIGKDTWHIYHTSLIRTDMRVDKIVDYRIHEYHRLKREGII